MSILWVIAAFFLVIPPSVLVHEGGHFIAARLCGIQVEEFGFGLPPRALTLFQHKRTVFSLNWVPLGGFVRPSGENDPTVAGGLAASPPLVRFFVLVAGALANWLMALLVLWLAFMLGPRATKITAVYPDSPALQAGLLAGDVLVAVDGIKGDSPRLLLDIIDSNRGRPLSLSIQRDGQNLEVTITPDPDANAPGLGVAFDQPHGGTLLTRTPGEAAREAIDYVAFVVTTTFSAPGQLTRGEMALSDARPVSVIGISQLAGLATAKSFLTGSFFPYLLVLGIINIALGLTQMLPLPALDGGRILFVLLEIVRGRPVAPQRETAVHRTGMILLLLLMVVLLLNDVINPLF